MGKYKYGTTTIDAWKVGVESIPDWIINKINNNEIILKSPISGKISDPFEDIQDTYVEMKTLKNNIVIVNHGDYIIKGINNEILKCAATIFDDLYKKVNINDEYI